MDSRQCPECSAEFTPRNGRARFCTPHHKEAFHTRNAIRGQILTGLAMSWRAGKHGAGDVSKFAHREMCALLDRYIAEDRAAGRLFTAPVRERMDMAWRAADLI